MDYQKAFKKLNLFFLSNPVSLNGQIYQKQKGSGTSHQSLFRSWNKFRNSFNRYILSDQVWWCNVKLFLTYPKNYICKFMQVISWHLNYSTSICFFESGKCGKEGKESQEFEYLENKKIFLDETKSIFHSF